MSWSGSGSLLWTHPFLRMLRVGHQWVIIIFTYIEGFYSIARKMLHLPPFTYCIFALGTNKAEEKEHKRRATLLLYLNDGFRCV